MNAFPTKSRQPSHPIGAKVIGETQSGMKFPGVVRSQHWHIQTCAWRYTVEDEKTGLMRLFREQEIRRDA